jgi:hypothetical protein
VGYHGAFWVDALTPDLLRLEVKEDEIPPFLNLKRADDVISYARTRIGSADFVLPQASEVMMQDLKGNEDHNPTAFGQCRNSVGNPFSRLNRQPQRLRGKRQNEPKVEIELPPEFHVDAGLETPPVAEETAGR